MKNIYTSVLALLFITLPFISNGQNHVSGSSQTSRSIYLERAAEVRAEVWAWDIPAFTNYLVPEVYSDESAVILARHRQIDATARKGSFWTNPAGKIFYTDIDRRLIKIQDQTALNNFSEYSFKEETRYSGASNLAMTIIGARIIKPDGTVNEVNVSLNSVAMTEGRTDKEVYRKLAIPQLQKDDILDIFICEVREFSSASNLPVQFMPFFEVDYPAMNYSFQLVFGKNLTIEYRSINGAPLLATQTDGNKNITLFASSDKVLRINDVESLQWLSEFRDLPMIRFSILQNASKIIYKPKSARPLGVHENISFDQILEDAKWYLAAGNKSVSFLKETRKNVLDIVANYKKNNPTLDTKELANVLYASLNFEWGRFPHGTFILMLDQLLKDNGIDSKIGFTTNKYNARKEEVVTNHDLLPMIVANNGSQLFFTPYRYRVPGEIPAGLQGESAILFTLDEILSNLKQPTKINVRHQEIITIPETAAEDNINRMRIKVQTTPNDNSKLIFKRNSTWTGELKNEIQPWLLLYENWDTTMRQYLHIDKSLMEELNEKRRTRKLTDQIEGIFEKGREEYKENIKQEIVAYHNAEPYIINDYSFVSFGVTETQPNLEYEVNYVMDGLVRTAGENLILDAGKLIGAKWTPTDNERARNVNAYIPTARIFESDIFFTIPDGYTAGELEHLNVDYSNEYLSFEATATIEGNTINIKAKKSYYKAFVPVDDWYSLIEIIDKTNDFCSSSIILQKG